MPRLILASTSPYRKRLLQQVGLDFEQQSPGIEETRRRNEAPETMAGRLAFEKAEAVASKQAPGSTYIVIGSDQVCHVADTIYSKPGNHETAKQHLSAFSGTWVTFSSSLTLLTSDERHYHTVENFRVLFRTLSANQINDYLLADKPYDCAGAIKVEQLGITLLADTQGRDINSLYGLPLMALTDGLRDLKF